MHIQTHVSFEITMAATPTWSTADCWYKSFICGLAVRRSCIKYYVAVTHHRRPQWRTKWHGIQAPSILSKRRALLKGTLRYLEINLQTLKSIDCYYWYLCWQCLLHWHTASLWYHMSLYILLKFVTQPLLMLVSPVMLAQTSVRNFTEKALPMN